MRKFDTQTLETSEFVAEWTIELAPAVRSERRRSEDRRRADRRTPRYLVEAASIDFRPLVDDAGRR